MRCPKLAELPPPPAGKTGWPWTVETPQLVDAMPDGGPWPRISVVTPSYNQGEFIEETIRSVLLQGYPDLEYIVMDGGSSDETLSILKKYDPWFAHLQSNKDRGQAHAINKGFALATGTIGAYLNSDDFYLYDVLGYVAGLYMANRPRFIFARNGSYRPRSIRARVNSVLFALPEPLLLGHPAYSISQESSFWSIAETGSFDERMFFCLDLDFFLTNISGARITLTSKPVGYFRDQPRSKSNNYQHVAREEHRKIISEKVTWRPSIKQVSAIRRLYWVKSIFQTATRRLPLEFSYIHPGREDSDSIVIDRTYLIVAQ
jgi:glycosyltransferase involved in cell wall biosynthesis